MLTCFRYPISRLYSLPACCSVPLTLSHTAFALPAALPSAPCFAHPQDSAGRVFMFDRAGNIYYDTEDPRLGMYIVSSRTAAVLLLECGCTAALPAWTHCPA